MARSQPRGSLHSVNTMQPTSALPSLDESPSSLSGWKMKIDQNPDRLYFVCTLIGACNLIILCAAALALLRVLRAAARDLYNSPRRRLLELDDGVARRNPGKIYALCLACRPWTAQKALLAIVALVAALRVAWAVMASHAWDAGTGLIRGIVHQSTRISFYSVGFFEAAAIFTLFTMVARFWAELASAARQRTISTRPLGGGDEYRPRGTPPVIWKIAQAVQRVSCAVAYAAAAIASLLQATIWLSDDVYVSPSVAVFEAAAYILAALVMGTFAHYAIAELRLVPIELPTRRRRVFRIAAVTVICTACLIIRAGVLVWAAGRAFPVDTNVEVFCILAYFLLLEALPLAIVLMYNRTTPLSTSRPPTGRIPSVRRRSLPEEEPLIGGVERSIEDNVNPFNSQTEIPRAIVHR